SRAAGAAGGMGRDVLREERRLSPTAQCPPGGGAGAGRHPGRLYVGGRHRPGEVFRPGEPRRVAEPGAPAGEGSTGGQFDPPVPESWSIDPGGEHRAHGGRDPARGTGYTSYNVANFFFQGWDHWGVVRSGTPL